MESNTIQPTPLVEVKNEQGQTVSEYQIGKRDSYVVVAQLSPEFTARLVDRWQELESKQPALPDFSNPVEAARAWADAKESEQKLLLEAKENAPKIEFYEQVTGSTDTVDMAQAAKVLNMGIGRNKLFELLRDKKVLQHNNQPYQTYIDRGYFRMVESKFQKPTGDTHISIKTVVYQKGLDYIRKLIKESKK
jgi:phage antirepressor YoqD-like protein